MLFNAYNALKNITPPESCEEEYKGILDDFSEYPFADTLESIDKLLKD